MTNTDFARYETLVRIRNFGAEHKELLEPGSIAEQAFNTIKMAVADLNAHGVSQLSGRSSARQDSATKAVAREKLRAMLSTINKLARVMADDIAGIEDKFRLPGRSGARRVVMDARTMLADARPLEAAFIAHGMPKDFLARLDEQIAAVESAIDEHATSRGVSAAARASIEATMDRALTAQRKLEAMVPLLIGDNPPVKAAWDAARRIQFPWTRTRIGEPATGSTDAAAAAATGAHASAGIIAGL